MRASFLLGFCGKFAFVQANFTSYVLRPDPSQGPRIPGWSRYDPQQPSTLALLGTSTQGALPGDHASSDRSCAYWNKILPVFPQVSGTAAHRVGIRLITTVPVPRSFNFRFSPAAEIGHVRNETQGPV